MARPSKYSPQRVAPLLQALRAGNTRRAACLYGGISEDTLARWRRQFPAFAAEVEQAEAAAEVRHVANVARAASRGNWTASAWWLERRRPREWGRREQVDVTLVRQEAARLAVLFELPTEVVQAELDRVLRERAS